MGPEIMVQFCNYVHVEELSFHSRRTYIIDRCSLAKKNPPYERSLVGFRPTVVPNMFRLLNERVQISDTNLINQINTIHLMNTSVKLSFIFGSENNRWV